MSALSVCLIVCGASCASIWVLSLITKSHSWIDRFWSIIPLVYLWIFAGAAQFSDLRLNVMAVLVTLWGIRLTFNFARKGGYRPGAKDYRWEMMRARMKSWQFALFNLFFISIYQNIILLLIALPAWTALSNPTSAFGWPDLIVTAVFLLFLVGETVADQQQWNFQQWKVAEHEAGREADPRFLQSGLFRFSRHPNFFFELAQWWALFLFGAIAAGSVWQWTVAGAVLLTVLFIGSTVFTESISKNRYPEYADYQRRTSPLIPWPPRRERVMAA